MVLEAFDASTLVLGVAIALFVLTLLTADGKKYKNLPPGPRGLPVVGNLLSITRSPMLHKDLHEMSKRYGPVVRLRFGSHYAFALNGYDILKEAFIDKWDMFSDRPLWMDNIRKLQREKGIFFFDGWKERRRFLLVSMRDFGLGKKSLEDRMVDEARFLNEEIAKSEGDPIDMSALLPFATANIISAVILGQRFQYGDAGFERILNTMNDIARGSPLLNLQNFVPLFRYLPSKDFKIVQEGLTRLIETCSQWKRDHESTFDPDNIRDLIDLCIAENRRESGRIQDVHLAVVILDLFFAGTETTSTTLSWALLYMIHRPNIQERCRKEIFEAIGEGRSPIYSDIKNTPYVNAVMNEVQRIGNILPFSIWHTAVQDTELGGYTIPKDSVLLMNLEAALRDDKYWKDAHTFNPDRWLDKEGKLVKNAAFIPFSIGKRVCLGEQLAKKEYYIFLTSMLQKFRFRMADEKNPPGLEGVPGVVHGPGKFKLIADRL